MKQNRFLYLLLLLFVVWHTPKCVAQNLVQNPSFEDFINCPQTLGNLDNDVTGWQTPTNGSTDYFNGCSTAMGTPKNFNGEQPADFGTAYVGLYFYAPADYREYVQARLKSTLKKGEQYSVSFYVSLAERSDFAIKEFGILFSENPINVNTRKTLSRMHLSKVSGDVSNYFEIRYSDFYSDKDGWVLVEKEFIANGTENYILIGNFKDNKRTQKFQTKRNVTKGSYYYLDMVQVNSKQSIVDVKDSRDTELQNEKTFELNKKNVFKNVLFEFDAYELISSAKTELDQIQKYLAENERFIISISGHTDAIGAEEYNKVLSQKRAEAVARYLINKGISADRISYRGYGSTQPVSGNTSSSDRKKNRRVEFVITTS